MKRFLVFLLVVLVLSACAPVAQGFVDLPTYQETAILSFIGAVFALAVNWLITFIPSWIGEFLRKYQVEWSVALGTAFIAWIENILPTGFEDVSIKGIDFILAVVVLVVPYLLARNYLARKGVKGFMVQ